MEAVFIIHQFFFAMCIVLKKLRTYLTIILRNRAEYRLILSRRGHRPSRLKSDDILGYSPVLAGEYAVM